MSDSTMNHGRCLSHYLFQAVPLLEQCERELQSLLTHAPEASRYNVLMELQETLVAIDNMLLSHLQHLSENLDTSHESSSEEPQRAVEALDTLMRLLRRKEGANDRVGLRNPQDPSYFSHERRHSPYENAAAKTAVDTLLFRLIVSLELLQVRMDDAHYVILGYRREKQEKTVEIESRIDPKHVLMLGVCIGVGLVASRKDDGKLDRIKSIVRLAGRRHWLALTAKAGATFLSFQVMNGFAKYYWMTDKIARSTSDFNDWKIQWDLIHRRGGSWSHSSFYSVQALSTSIQNSSAIVNANKVLGLDDKSRALIEHAMKHGRKTYFWRSTGEIRFLMLKRFMDVYYASVGTAISTKQTSSLSLPLVTGAAASFYSVTGVSQKALSGVMNDSSRDLIRHAWGMVSLPALKSLMLQASRLIKGASVADRIIFCGVPCIILSKDPVPELAAILQPRAKRRSSSTANLSQLSTIRETEIHSHEEDANFGRKSFVGRCGDFRQRDVILHLTGGGFFAHTIASDLPFLMEWSSKTGAVVLCPEYALLPEHHFPVALDQTTTIYSALASGDTGKTLGFEVNRVCLTGESAGGNLAAALCVHLARLADTPATILSSGESSHVRMPDGIMLSCAALNLTTQLSLSRFLGTEDPVLPNALISAISDAYLPSDKGCDKKDPLASPFFAPDEVLRKFPPTLLFASSNDPLLDDSVVFNERLRAVGVRSELIAAQNVPHAYLGLGTAGFPEAVQVQNRAIYWLNDILHS